MALLHKILTNGGTDGLDSNSDKAEKYEVGDRDSEAPQGPGEGNNDSARASGLREDTQRSLSCSSANECGGEHPDRDAETSVRAADNRGRFHSGVLPASLKAADDFKRAVAGRIWNW